MNDCVTLLQKQNTIIDRIIYLPKCRHETYQFYIYLLLLSRKEITYVCGRNTGQVPIKVEQDVV